MSVSPGHRTRHRGLGLIRIGLYAALVGTVLLAQPRAYAQHRLPAPFIDAGTITDAMAGTPVDLDPASNQGAYADTIIRNISEPLIQLAGASTDSFAPVLATSWTVNPDKSVYIFHLRHGVRFHTGRCCMTAADVQYSLARTMLAGLTNSYVLARFMTKPFQQIKIRDPYTVEFDLGRPQPIFLDQIASLYISLIVDAQAVKAHEQKHDWGHAWLTDHDAGTGPYMLQSWVHGQQEVLTRFPQYWAGWSGPHFSTVVVRTVPDSTTRRELLERGQADLTYDLTPQDYDALKHNPQISVNVAYGTEILDILMTEAGPLASPYARQALSYAFNYDAFIHGIMGGYARRAYGPLASTLLGYDPQLFHYQTDLTKARALLRKAGVKPGTTLTFAYYDPYGTAAGILQAQLAQLGITVKIEHIDETAFDNMYYGTEPPSQRPNLMGYSWWPDFNDPYDECYSILDSAAQGAAGANGNYYHNAEVDALLAQMKNADRESLIRDAYRLQDLTSRLDPPAIWTAEPAQVTVLARNVRGFVYNPIELRTYAFYPMYRTGTH